MSDVEISSVSTSDEEDDDDDEKDFEPVVKNTNKISSKESSVIDRSMKDPPAKKRKVVKKEDSDSDDDMPLAALANKKKKPLSSSKRNGSKSVGENKTVKKPPKDIPPLKMLEFAMQAHKWWEDPPMSGDDRWHTLEHNGVMFPPPYKPHGVKLLYDGNPVDLNPEQEEVATLYAEIPLDGPQLGDEKTAKVFNANFFEDFKEVLGKGHVIKSFSKCDFTLIRAHVTALREKKKNKTKEEKDADKLKADKQRMVYSFALVDGHLQKVGNVMVEPPGLFRGRGDHPKTGKLKRRVMPEQVTINIGPTSPVPPCQLPGHAWGRVVHKKEVTWLAYWKENIMGGTKYVWLAASSGFKGQADMEKYEKARRLKNKIKVIRTDYEKKLSSKNKAISQLGTAMWVIDRLALRVGNEKDDDEADTVGCCSLRCEHVIVDKVNETITLDFLGKDSMRHHQQYNVVQQYGEVGRKVIRNIESFLKGKKPSDQLLDKLEVSTLNDHLKTLMPGLSAKVFRTMNASFTLQDRLPNNVDPLTSDQEKVQLYNNANREVAILCNHQRTVSTAAQGNIEKLAEYVELLKAQHEQLKNMLRRRKKGKEVKLKPGLKEGATMDEKRKVAHLFQKQPRTHDVEKRINMWAKKIKAQELQYKMKEDNKSVALSTSKINYCDPRITVAFAKKFEVPIERLFSGILASKFTWAMAQPADFVW